MKKTIVISINTSWNLINFRKGLLFAIKKRGYKLIALAPVDKYTDEVKEYVDEFCEIKIDKKGINPIKDFLLFTKYFSLLKYYKPDFYLSYTIKPNIYGSLAANLLGINVINNIAGLGTTFSNQGLVNKIVKFLYKISLANSHKIFFQNLEDSELFIKNRILTKNNLDILPGSGVDLEYFSNSPMLKNKHLRFILISRMLWDKGIGEYIDAIKIVKKQYPNVEFCLLGFVDIDNKLSISINQINEWVSDGLINYLGMRDDVRDEIKKSDCVVLPSYYREGTPRILLEAASIGRPIITTDNVGCRDVVENNFNGYLCKPRDAIDLSKKILNMINLDNNLRQEMGHRSRLIAEKKYDEKIVISKYLNCIDDSEIK